MTSKYIQLLETDGTWDAFRDDWEGQCGNHEEDFSDYAANTFSVIGDIIKTEHQKAGVFAFCEDDKHMAICQINVAGLPKYDSPVMRARYLTLCPDIDFGDTTIDQYAKVLAHAFSGILALSDREDSYGAKHIKFHLRSPADRNFFTLLGQGLNDSEEFASVQTVGTWLYITKS